MRNEELWSSEFFNQIISDTKFSISDFKKAIHETISISTLTLDFLNK
jgi:hypothetical protein